MLKLSTQMGEHENFIQRFLYNIQAKPSQVEREQRPKIYRGSCSNNNEIIRQMNVNHSAVISLWNSFDNIPLERRLNSRSFSTLWTLINIDFSVCFADCLAVVKKHVVVKENGFDWIKCLFLECRAAVLSRTETSILTSVRKEKNIFSGPFTSISPHARFVLRPVNSLIEVE